MQKLNILIVENTTTDADLIKQLIENSKQAIVNSITTAFTYDEAVNILSQGVNFDLSILDVELDGHTSFELIKEFSSYQFGLVAFMTRWAIPAEIIQMVHPVLQILKPFDREQIAGFISKVIAVKKSDIDCTYNKVDVLRFIEDVKEAMRSESLAGKNDNVNARLFGIKTPKGEQEIVDVNDICSVEAKDKLTKYYIYDRGKAAYCSKVANETLGEVLKRLKPYEQFVQCFKSWIINTEYITKIRPERRHGGIFCTDHTGCKEIPYSDTFKDEIARKINSTKL